MPNKPHTTAATDVAGQIRVVRGHRVLLDSDLAALYGVATKSFNQAVRRNIDRFPADFLLRLTETEADSLRSQIVTLKTGRGRHRKYLPLASHAELARKLETLEKSVASLDASVRKQFEEVYGAILSLMGPAVPEH
jgi:hypothetical protein